MFYVKEKLSDSAEIKIEIHDENVFCRCPKCGCEVPVDLAEVLSDGVRPVRYGGLLRRV